MKTGVVKTTLLTTVFLMSLGQVGYGLTPALPSCNNQEAHSYVTFLNGTKTQPYVIWETISESDTTQESEQIAVVFCPSRKAVVVREGGFVDGTVWETERVFTDAIYSEEIINLRGLKRLVSKEGGKATIETLPEKHCVCNPDALDD